MTLEILQVPGCPGADLLAATLDGLLAGRARITRRVVTSQADAERLGMSGSLAYEVHGPRRFALTCERVVKRMPCASPSRLMSPSMVVAL